MMEIFKSEFAKAAKAHEKAITGVPGLMNKLIGVCDPNVLRISDIAFREAEYIPCESFNFDN